MSAMTTLDTLFVVRASDDPTDVQHGGETYHFAVPAEHVHWETEGIGIRANLEVTQGGNVIGYIFPFGEDDWRALPASSIKTEVDPPRFALVEEAIDHMIG